MSKLARLSLSLNLSSLTDTVSFSLTTGMTPQFSSSLNVLRILRNRVRFLRSSRVSKTCAVRMPRSAKALSYRCMSRPCPTAAAACLPLNPTAAGSPGNFLSAVRPAATAPDDTSTTRAPCAEAADSAATREFSFLTSRCPDGCVNELEPTLTTMVRAPAMARRTSDSVTDNTHSLPDYVYLESSQTPVS